MKFAIILPTYNRAWLLPQAIESVISQTYRDWSLCIVNDGSTDDTDIVVAPYLSDSRIHYIRSDENKGHLHARNIALDLIGINGADWFTEMDDDDRLLSGCLKIAHAEIRRYPGYGLFVFATMNPDGTPITRMKITGPRNFLWNRMLCRRVTGDAHEFGAIRSLEGQRLYAPTRMTMHRVFWGEFSLKAGSVFCNQPTKIKEYLPDGISRTVRSRNRLQKTNARLTVARSRVCIWRNVISRHRSACLAYCVYIKLLFHVAKQRLILWILPRGR